MTLYDIHEVSWFNIVWERKTVNRFCLIVGCLRGEIIPNSNLNNALQDGHITFHDCYLQCTVKSNLLSTFAYKVTLNDIFFRLFWNNCTNLSLKYNSMHVCSKQHVVTGQAKPCIIKMCLKSESENTVPTVWSCFFTHCKTKLIWYFCLILKHLLFWKSRHKTRTILYIQIYMNDLCDYRK